MKNSREDIFRLSRRRGFSFIEVLFAIILLGIGFILIAGVFPVAIQQTTAVSDETQGVLIARDAIRKVQALAAEQVAVAASEYTLFPSTLDTSGNPQVVTFSFPNPLNPTTPPPTLQQALGDDVYNTADRRYGWVGFYRRDSISSPLAQVFVIALENPNFPNYYVTTNTPLQPLSAANAPQTITPTSTVYPICPPIPPSTYGTAPPTTASITAAFSYIAATGTTTVTLSNFGSGAVPNGVTGAYVLVANTTNVSSPVAPVDMIGRFYRLGTVPSGTAVSSTSQTFYLEPGWDVTSADVPTGDATYSFNANVFVIGAAPPLNSPQNNPNAAAQNDYTPLPGTAGVFTGSNQDIAVASGFIRVNTNNN